MMKATVKSIKPTKDNNGAWVELQSADGKFSALAGANINISALKVGSEAYFNLETRAKKDGTGNWSSLKSFSFEGSAPIGAVNTPVTRNSGLSEPELRFISNVVGSAIQHGMVLKPEEVTMWSKAGLDALNSLKLN